MLVLRFDEFTYLCFQDAKFNLAPDRAGTCFLHHHVCSFLTLSPRLCSTPAACMCEPASAVSDTCCWKKGERKRGSHSTPRPAAHAVLADTRAPPPALHEVARASRCEPPAEQTVRASWRNLPPPPLFFLEEIVK